MFVVLELGKGEKIMLIVIYSQQKSRDTDQALSLPIWFVHLSANTR